jgi:hypothetical protein
MSPPTEFEFVVGGEYENEKGVFTVMSIVKDQMMIQWASGEGISTSIEFQSRIQERRQREHTIEQERVAAAKPVPKKAKRAKSGKQPPSA